jgi:hypothetical protein
MRSIEKKIHFLKVASTGVSFESVLMAIDKLPEDQLYFKTDEFGGGVCLKELHVKNDVYLGVLSKVRMDELPSVATTGRRGTEALMIAENQGLAESTHFAYFSKTGLLAIEYNHYGPRSSTLRAYLIGKYNDIGGEPLPLVFEYILDEETLNLLADGNEIRLLSISVPKMYLGSLANEDENIYAAFENASHFAEGGEVEITMRMPSNKRNPDYNSVRQALLAKTRGLASMAPGVFSKLKAKVKPPVGRTVSVDLLENRFVARIIVDFSGRSNDLNSTALYDGMIHAYQSNRKALALLSEYEQFDQK